MPPYDPKANRPKLVPVDDDAAPVDALLGADAAVGTATAATPPRPRLSVVSDDEPAPRPAADPVVAAPVQRFDAKAAVVVATAVAVIVGIVVVLRRR